MSYVIKEFWDIILWISGLFAGLYFLNDAVRVGNQYYEGSIGLFGYLVLFFGYLLWRFHKLDILIGIVRFIAGLRR